MNKINHKCVFSGPLEPLNFKERSLGQLIYNSLRSQNSSNVALIDVGESRQLTYGDLLEYSLKLAQVLKEQFNVRHDDVVAIISTNSWKSIVVIISTFICGGTVCSLNPNYSKLELLNSFKICEPKIVFALESAIDRIKLIENLESINVEKVIFDSHPSKIHFTFEEILIGVEVKNIEFKEYNSREKVCFILNSSGTTGLPKGVMLTEEGMRQAFMYLTEDSFKLISETTISLAILPLFHIFGVLTTFASIVTGRKTVILNKFSPKVFLKCISDYGINTLFVVPQILSFMSTTPLLEEYDISSIEVILVGGAPLLRHLEEKVTKRLPNVRIQQAYGATEICGAITIMPCDSVRVGSVGKLIPNMQAKIVDVKFGEVSSHYQTGEICLRSPGIMKGYKENAEETNNAIKGGWWYTGDIGYFDEDEYLYIMGRIKELIKFKGFQVAPAQLEEIISKHPGVKDVGVVGKPDERAGELPTAFVVKNYNTVSENEIINFVKGKLSPESELHGGVVFVEQIPRNPSGKILRQQLKEMISL